MDEQTYLDLITKLHEDIQSDSLPKDIRESAQKILADLMNLLLPYSG